MLKKLIVAISLTACASVQAVPQRTAQTINRWLQFAVASTAGYGAAAAMSDENLFTFIDSWHDEQVKDQLRDASYLRRVTGTANAKAGFWGKLLENRDAARSAFIGARITAGILTYTITRRMLARALG